MKTLSLREMTPRNLLRRSRPERRPLILMYHRIADLRGSPDSDPWGNAVSPANFAHHLDILSRNRVVLSLNQFCSRVQAQSAPPDSVVITFDDGYADNLYAAKPLLQTYGTPATVFVVSSTIDRSSFWWDELADIFLRPGILPTHIRLKRAEQVRDLKLCDAARLTAEDARTHQNWRGWDAPPTPRHALFRSLWRWLRQLPDSRRGELLCELRDWAGHAPSPSAARPLSSSELACLAGGGLVEIGAHTATHPSLPSLGTADQEHEIRQSKGALEARLGHQVKSFSYPHGDHNAASVACVRASGFERACITGQARVRWPADPLRLPRIQVENWEPDEFEQRLAYGFVA